jgi:regulator of protease activity HflC (stomatin/prohibitin superfamily)
MIHVIIHEGQRGLLVRDGRLVELLPPGRHRRWSLFGRQLVEHLDVSSGVTELSPALERVLPADAATRLEVLTDQAALVSRDGVPARVLTAGRWALWPTEGRLDVATVDLLALHSAIPSRFWPLAPGLVQEVVVHPFERVLVYVDGTLVEVLGPGRYGLGTWQRKLELGRYDLREQELQVAGQELVTADKVSLRLNVLLKYAVADPVAAAQSVHNLHDALYAEVQIATRQSVAGVTVDGLLERRVELAREMVAHVADRARTWGIDVRRLELKDVILPGEMKTLLNQVIEAEKRAAAQVILRREEVAATRSLANTARLMESNPVLMRLKEMEALKEMTEKIGTLNVVMAPKELQDLLRLGK